MKYDAIVLAGGTGKRAKLGFNKVLYKMKDGRTVLYHSCLPFINDHDCQNLIAVCNFELDFKDNKIIKVEGGKERYNSVLNGLSAVKSAYVLIHDGARPFLDIDDLNRLKEAIKKYDNAILAKKAIDTIKYVNDDLYIDKTIDRDHIYYALTPQGFKTSLIKEAYQNINLKGITDDASVMEKYGYKVKIVECLKDNKKLTLKEDFNDL